MRYIFIEITEAHAEALSGCLDFKLTEPEPCQVRCMVKTGESETPANPFHELLRLIFEKLIRVYDDEKRGIGACYYQDCKVRTEELLTALKEL